MQPVRVVIRQLGAWPTSSYRVIVYGDKIVPRNYDFSNEQILIETLRVAIPRLDVSHLSMDPLGEEGNGSIVFAGGMDLDENQLALLGSK
ncbi:MAG: hypothetical protein WBQ94_07965 [Terracidiphilus sp.]